MWAPCDCWQRRRWTKLIGWNVTHCLKINLSFYPQKTNQYAYMLSICFKPKYMLFSCFKLFVLVGLQQTMGFHLLCLCSLAMLLSKVVVWSSSVIFVWSYKVIFFSQIFWKIKSYYQVLFGHYNGPSGKCKVEGTQFCCAWSYFEHTLWKFVFCWFFGSKYSFISCFAEVLLA